MRYCEAEPRKVDMTEKEKMLAGELYNAADEGIQYSHRAAMAWLVRYLLV